MKVNDPTSEEKRSKGLIPVTFKSGEIMRVHPDVINDEQWESTRPKRKGKSCNMISFALNEDANVPTNFLTDSDEEQIVLVVQPTEAPPVGTRSGKTYLK